MSIITDIFSAIGSFALSTIHLLGYGGVFFLMMLESMVVPVPSEFVMPFAGFLIWQGDFTFVLVIIFSTLGSITGSLLSYYFGKRWGNQIIVKYGKYFFVDTEDLKKTETWFMKRGNLTIFISRLVPVIRHLISIVAGISKMNVKKFMLYTILGATIWNTFLTYLGYLLGQHWHDVTSYTKEIDIIIVVILIIGCIFFIYRHLNRKNKRSMKE